MQTLGKLPAVLDNPFNYWGISRFCDLHQPIGLGEVCEFIIFCSNFYSDV